MTTPNMKVTKGNGTTPYLFGIEFECCHPNALELYNKYHKFFYATFDGSLGLNGIEFVSQPLSVHMLLKQLQRMKKHFPDVYSDRNGAIHIHVSRTKDIVEKADILASRFEQETPNNLFCFFGRYPNTYCVAHKNKYDKYRLVNFTKPDTIEFRGFVNTPTRGMPYEAFGWDWAQICVKRLDALLRNPTKSLTVLAKKYHVLDK